MPQRIGVFRENDAKRVARATRIVEGAPGTFLRVPERIPRTAPGGGDCTCVTVHEIKFEGSVTGGSVTMAVGIDPDGMGADVENIVIAYDDTAAEVQTAYEGHSNIAGSGADITVQGGQLPDAAVYIVFLSTGALNRNQPLPTVNTNSLTGTNVKIKSSYMTNADWEA